MRREYLGRLMTAVDIELMQRRRWRAASHRDQRDQSHGRSLGYTASSQLWEHAPAVRSQRPGGCRRREIVKSSSGRATPERSNKETGASGGPGDVVIIPLASTMVLMRWRLLSLPCGAARSNKVLPAGYLHPAIKAARETSRAKGRSRSEVQRSEVKKSMTSSLRARWSLPWPSASCSFARVLRALRVRAPCRASRWTRHGPSFRTTGCSARFPGLPSTGTITSGSCIVRGRSRRSSASGPRRRCWNSTRRARSLPRGEALAPGSSGPTASTGSLSTRRTTCGLAAAARPQLAHATVGRHAAQDSRARGKFLPANQRPRQERWKQGHHQREQAGGRACHAKSRRCSAS